jgi:hypothetical protein
MSAKPSIHPLDPDAARLLQAAESASDAQLFRFEPRDGGPYGLLRVKSSAHVLDVSGAATGNGAPLILYAEHGGGNQLFRFEPTAHGAGVFRAKHSGKVIDDSCLFILRSCILIDN